MQSEPGGRAFQMQGCNNLMGNFTNTLLAAVASAELERTKHSEKPNEFRTIINAIYLDGERLELFARQNYIVWDDLGNEVENSIKL